jgi:hypothetical protein
MRGAPYEGAFGTTALSEGSPPSPPGRERVKRSATVILSAAKDLRSWFCFKHSRETAEMLRCALLKITPTASFPRKRESSSSKTWTPAFAGVTGGIFISSGGPKAHENSVESHVIPAKAGIQFFQDMDPRLRGGDGVTFICTGGPQAHGHSA